MGAGANQANGLSDAVVGGAGQTTRSSHLNQPSEPTDEPNNGLDQSGSTERGGATRDQRLAGMTIEQASGRNYPVMGLDVRQVIPNWHAASEFVFRVPSREGAQQINWLPGNHEEEPVADEANGLSVHRVERALQRCIMSYLDLVNEISCRPYGTAAREALPFPIQEDVTCLPVQEQGEGDAAPQAPILLPDVLPDEPNLVSSVGNAVKPTVNRCSTEKIKQWKQQLTRSNPQTAVLKMGNAQGTFFIMVEVSQHRRYETPILSDAEYSYRFGRLMGIRIYPNGVGSGRGTHVAIFIHLMKSTFDDLLDWPFDGTITVSVLDRRCSRARSNISRIIQAKPNLLAFQQPHEAICRTGYGYERFARIEEFFGPGYVRDDKLLLKIEFSG
ncbi:TNF receptor-associated factor 4-like [Montipora capricornis]|uniref:TNF receptor-associated factor 4-like n=1 Tax=Montipora capricornis TaxID=246305 RepID=UPI0035F123FF